ncbi:uncharacterized protein [Parasteatoda tepidariorum]|uniref:uncharacterized protein isoform X5 n=1 Tax=Parasteatoda tepidariorum TaxID=114398 RepID=UPI0039BD0A75
MNDNKSKTFFVNLKETVSIIDKRVNDVTTTHSDIPTECNFSEVYQDLDTKLNNIKDLKKDALNMKEELEAKQDYFGRFYQDFQDLVLEIEEKVSWHEKYLQKFGYEPPLKYQMSNSGVASNFVEEMLILSKSSSVSIFKEFLTSECIEIKSSELEASGGTPHLCFDQDFERCNKSPELPVMEDYSLNTGNASSDCFGDYKKLARKLDF